MTDSQTTKERAPVENVLKGDAGTAAKDASAKVAEEKRSSAVEEALAAVRGTEKDTDGRTIPIGEAAEDPFFQAVARYFEVHERNFKDASHDLGFIIEYLKNKVGVKSVEEIDKMFTFLRTLEDNLSPEKDFDSKRYQRVYNYLILKEKADAMNMALSMLEKNRGSYGD